MHSTTNLYSGDHKYLTQFMNLTLVYDVSINVLMRSFKLTSYTARSVPAYGIMPRMLGM